MIALSVSRAGTVPIIDMSFHIPLVYIFGVLEVNIAIIAASIPIFWPVIVTLAGNKIFVLNEVEIHVEEASRSSFNSERDIGLIDQAAWKDSNRDDAGRTSLSVLARTYNRTTSSPGHRYKHSNTSSLGRTLGLDFGHRCSSDSQRRLNRTPTDERGCSKGSLARTDPDDWFLEVDKQLAGGRTTTTVQKADVPIEHIKAFDSR